MNGHFDLVIFDCDGVLVDSERLCVQVEAELITQTGWPLTPAEVAGRFLGKSDEHMLAEIERQVGRALGADWLAGLHERYRDRFRRDLTAVPGVVAALDGIAAAGVPTCVASSGTPEKMATTLGITGLADRFDGRIFSAVEVEHGKPAPDLFLHAAKKMGVPPGRCAVVEDSPAGVAAGRAAGMTVLGYRTELVPPGALTGERTIEFEDMRELPRLLGLR
ncbi:HAD family hydrolase [Crossiella sp. NPDC003009]